VNKGKILTITNKIGSKIKYCSKCKVKLDNKNWSKFYRRIKQYKCRKCDNKHIHEWDRKHILTTFINGKETILKGNKRPYPKDQKCEICKEVRKFLIYHHWDDKDISKGVWCCPFECHGLAETLDKNILLGNKYLKLKGKINEKIY